MQLKDIRAFYHSKRDGQWYLLQASRDVQGGAYHEDFVDHISVPANLRNEADGTISVVPGGGYNCHFWPSGRGVFGDPLDVDAVFVTVKARLIVNDASLAPDFDKAVYVMETHPARSPRASRCMPRA